MNQNQDLKNKLSLANDIAKKILLNKKIGSNNNQNNQNNQNQQNHDQDNKVFDELKDKIKSQITKLNLYNNQINYNNSGLLLLSSNHVPNYNKKNIILKEFYSEDNDTNKKKTYTKNVSIIEMKINENKWESQIYFPPPDSPLPLDIDNKESDNILYNKNTKGIINSKPILIQNQQPQFKFHIFDNITNKELSIINLSNQSFTLFGKDLNVDAKLEYDSYLKNNQNKSNQFTNYEDFLNYYKSIKVAQNIDIIIPNDSISLIHSVFQLRYKLKNNESKDQNIDDDYQFNSINLNEYDLNNYELRPYLMDLNSKNGTFISEIIYNNKDNEDNENNRSEFYKLKPEKYYLLKHGDIIKFGNCDWDWVFLID